MKVSEEIKKYLDLFREVRNLSNIKETETLKIDPIKQQVLNTWKRDNHNW